MEPNQSPINNQVHSPEQLATILSLKSISTFISCPGCKSIGVTKTTPECNVLSMITGCFCHPCWFCFHACNSKDLNCYDTTHHCINCGNLVGKYSSC